MGDGFSQIILTAMASAIAALWVRLGLMQRRIEELVKAEAECRTRMASLQNDLDRKHEENQAAFAALYNREPTP